MGKLLMTVVAAYVLIAPAACKAGPLEQDVMNARKRFDGEFRSAVILPGSFSGQSTLLDGAAKPRSKSAGAANAAQSGVAEKMRRKPAAVGGQAMAQLSKMPAPYAPPPAIEPAPQPAPAPAPAPAPPPAQDDTGIHLSKSDVTMGATGAILAFCLLGGPMGGMLAIMGAMMGAAAFIKFNRMK
ncbi:MAG: hypothetical protein WC421_05400 [Elusimicrobiales bacterium]